MKIWAKCRHEDDGRERWAIITCCSLSRTQPEHDLLAGKRENSNPTRVGVKALWILKYKQASTHSCQNILGRGRWHIVCQIGPVVSEIFWVPLVHAFSWQKFPWVAISRNKCLHAQYFIESGQHAPSSCRMTMHKPQAKATCTCTNCNPSAHYRTIKLTTVTSYYTNKQQLFNSASAIIRQFIRT